MRKLISGPLPDLTPPQLVAIAVAGIPIIASLLRAFGVFDLNDDQEQALSDAVSWSGVLGGSLIGGDALLRLGRNLRFRDKDAAVNTPAVVPASASTPITPAPPSTATTGFEDTPR